MMAFKDVHVPKDGEVVRVERGRWIVPDRPIVPFIEGDGIGRDIWPATRRVLDAGVQHAYGARRRIEWMEVYAGECAHERFGVWLPEETLEALRAFHVGIKGPLTTPVGGGIRSLNVTLRQVLDLYACIRPVRWIRGVPSPVRHPERLNIVIFRENTEDVYAGLEYAAGSREAKRLRAFLKEELKADVRDGSAIGIKPMSAFGTKRLVAKAIEYALAFPHPSPSVTLVHKGNIMKYTEGAFRDWGYEVARDRFGDRTVSEQDVTDRFGGVAPDGKIVIKDRIADSMFQQVLLRPDEYWVIALPNLNGDYLSDACAAQVGGLGMAPGANVGDDVAVFEATHGTAPKHAGQDKANPGSLILSGVMLLRHLGWTEAADAVIRALEATISAKVVTYDLERQMEGARKVATSEFAGAVIENLS